MSSRAGTDRRDWECGRGTKYRGSEPELPEGNSPPATPPGIREVVAF